jgi:hypothetical protein
MYTNSTSSVKIVSFSLILQPGRENVPLRPYTPTLDAGIINSLEGTGVYTASGIAGTVGAAIRPDMNNHTAAAIPNGWGTARYRGILQVMTTNHMGTGEFHQLTVYSDWADPALQTPGLLDENLPFRINEITTILAGHGMMNPGMATSGAIPAAPNMHLNLMRGADPATGVRLLSQRPADVFRLGADAFLTSMAPGMVGVDQTALNPLSAMATADMAQNASSARYAYNLMRAAVEHSSMPADLHASDSSAYVQSAITQQLTPASPMRNAFIAALSRAINDIGGTNAGNFTLRDLRAIDPSVNPQVQSTISQSIQYGTMQDNSSAAQIAAMYAQAVPGYMSANSLQTVKFIQGWDGECLIVQFGSYFASEAMTRHLNGFRTSMRSELWAAASHGGTMPFTIEVTCYIYGNITIGITDSRGRVSQYDYPAFAAAVYSPVVTNDPNGYLNLASAMHELTSTVADINVMKPTLAGYGWN